MAQFLGTYVQLSQLTYGYLSLDRNKSYASNYAEAQRSETRIKIENKRKGKEEIIMNIERLTDPQEDVLEARP